MAKTTKATARPRLRFPEFRDSPGWRKAPLAALLSEHGLKSDGQSQVHSVSLAKGIVPQIEHLGRSFAAADTSDYSLVRPGDVVYTRSPLSLFKLGIVKQHRAPRNAIVSPLYGVFSPMNKNAGTLIEAYFDSPSRNLRFLDPLAQKGAKNTIQLSNERFLSGEIHLPDDEREQQKIADCLTSLDDVIAAQAQKVEALKAHKRGLMQQLFPRDGEMVPRLRFRGFCDEWKERALGEVCESVASGRDKPDSNGAFDLYGSTGVLGRTDTATYNGRYLLVARVGANAGLLTDARGQFGVTDNTIVIALVDAASADFIYFYLQSVGLNRMVYGSGQPLITGTQLKNVVLYLPEPTEQQRVADVLTSLDAVVRAEADKLISLRSHKGGLMQQLFPSPDAD